MVSIPCRLRRSPSCFFACTLLQMWGCLLQLLPASTAAVAFFLPHFQGATFSPLQNPGWWKSGNALASPWSNPEGFQEGQFCRRLLGNHSL